MELPTTTAGAAEFLDQGTTSPAVSSSPLDVNVASLSPWPRRSVQTTS
jgi:hypothetical protein